jgi:hypothetical protein
VIASGDYRSRLLSGEGKHGDREQVDWFDGGRPPGHDLPPSHPSAYFPRADYGQATNVLPEHTTEMSAVTSAFTVTTQDVLDVLGPDADDLLATANLDLSSLISMINAETTLIPRID